MVTFTFSVFDKKYLFRASLVQNMKILVPSLIRIYRIRWWCSFLSAFDWKYPFLGKFSTKIQNCLFKIKFDTYTNPNMQNSVVVFILSTLYWKYPFWADSVEKVKIVSVSSNLVFRLNQISKIRWWSFFASFVQKTI